MRSIGEMSNHELDWTQTAGCRRSAYELRAGDELVATLRCQGGLFAIAETASGLWSFQRPGVRRSRVIVKEVENGTNTTFASNWKGGGILDLRGERRFYWTSESIWRSRHAWRLEDGTLLVRFRGMQRLVKVEGRVEVEEAARDLPELGLLVSLGWYLMVMRARDSTSDAVAATMGAAGS